MLPIPPQVVTFFGKRIVQAIIVLSLIAFLAYEAKSYHDSVYNAGVDFGINKENKVWVDREELRVKTQNENIDKLEKNAKELAEANKEAIRLRDARIVELDAKLAVEKKRTNTVIYKADGTPNMSVPADTQIWLGSEFTRIWNLYNTEILK
jgi:hypothetical protein